MSKFHMFLDESGAYGFKFASQRITSHIVVAAVLINENNLDDVTVYCFIECA